MGARACGRGLHAWNARSSLAPVCIWHDSQPGEKTLRCIIPLMSFKSVSAVRACARAANWRARNRLCLSSLHSAVMTVNRPELVLQKWPVTHHHPFVAPSCIRGQTCLLVDVDKIIFFCTLTKYLTSLMFFSCPTRGYTFKTSLHTLRKICEACSFLLPGYFHLLWTECWERRGGRAVGETE